MWLHHDNILWESVVLKIGQKFGLAELNVLSATQADTESGMWWLWKVKSPRWSLLENLIIPGVVGW